jgi:hypothetical protein
MRPNSEVNPLDFEADARDRLTVQLEPVRAAELPLGSTMTAGPYRLGPANRSRDDDYLSAEDAQRDLVAAHPRFRDLIGSVEG